MAKKFVNLQEDKHRIENSLSQYNMLLLAAEYDKTSMFFDMLDQYNLAQFVGSDSDCLFSKSLKLSSLNNNFIFLNKLLTKLKLFYCWNWLEDEKIFYLKKWITLLKKYSINIMI